MAPSDKMRQSPLGWPLGGGVGWRAGVWAGRPGGGVASAPALPALSSWEVRVRGCPFCGCVSPHPHSRGDNGAVVLASQSSPGRSTKPRCSTGPALGAGGALLGREVVTAGEASPRAPR